MEKRVDNDMEPGLIYGAHRGLRNAWAFIITNIDARVYLYKKCRTAKSPIVWAICNIFMKGDSLKPSVGEIRD